MKRTLLVVVLALGLTGCGLKLSDIVVVKPIVVDPNLPAPTPEPQPPTPPPAPTPEPVPVPEPQPEEPKPFQNLNIVVNDVETKLSIVGAQVENLTTQESRTSDGSGFVNFGVQGTVRLRVSATDYATEEVDREPGNRRVELRSTKPKPTLVHGVPAGPGGHGPANGPLPDMRSVVVAVAKANLFDLNRSCVEQGGSFRFMEKLVDVLRSYDTRFGFNGKRGNAADPSQDAIAYHFGEGPTALSTDVYIVDVIGGHCGPNPIPEWNDVTAETKRQGTIGRWITLGRF